MMRTVLGALAGFALAAGIGEKTPQPQAMPTSTSAPTQLDTPHPEGAAQSCRSITDEGSSTELLLKSMYTLDCAFESRNCNGVTCRFTSNCCAPSAWVRVNQGDWNQLRDQGKLSGLRYQMIPWSGSTYSVLYKRINGSSIELITPGEFLP